MLILTGSKRESEEIGDRMRFRGVRKVPGCHVDTGRIGCKGGAEGGRLGLKDKKYLKFSVIYLGCAFHLLGCASL